MAKQELPITASVIDWAVAASGYTLEEIAASVNVDPEDLEAWRRGRSKPGVTELRKLASKLHRPFAAFFLPEPPRDPGVSVEFRHPPGTAERDLNPYERRFLRRAHRLQRVLSWVAAELGEPEAQIPRARLQTKVAEAAVTARDLLGVSIKDQFAWRSSSIAFDAWRDAIEERRALVFLFPMGKNSSRGFSLWDDRAPIIAVNTAWNEEARVFTLLHEFGHLVTRTNSACVEGSAAKTSAATDPAERWCEAFAAEVLMPRRTVSDWVRRRGLVNGVRDLADVRWLANRFKVSLRAATIQLIEMGLATWDLYRTLPISADAKPAGGGGGGGRDLGEIRGDQLGRRTAELFQRGVNADVVTRTQALEYLDVADSDFDMLAESTE